MGVARAALLEAPGAQAAATAPNANANEDPDCIYIDCTKCTPTKKRSTLTKKKDSATKHVVKDSI
jgi:hypothetical protein